MAADSPRQQRDARIRMHRLRPDLRGGCAKVGARRLHWVGEISGNAEAGFPGFD
jgi:hypothetical protein